MAATSAQAALFAPKPPSQFLVEAAPPIELVAEGCGWAGTGTIGATGMKKTAKIEQDNQGQ